LIYSLNILSGLYFILWGLENKAAFPNFPAIKEILRHRFNVGIDDIKDVSPL
jgi:hypothetical protein